MNPFHVVLLGVSAITTGSLAGYAWTRRPKPGTTAFAGLMTAATVWTAAYAVALRTIDPTWRLFFEQVQWLGIATAPAWFLLFALTYTGVDDRLDRRWTAGLFVVPAITVALAFSEPGHGLLWADWTFRAVDGVVTADQTLGPWYWVNLAYTYALVAAASFLLLRLAVVSEYLYADQSALVAVGVAVPLVANAASILGFAGLPGLDLTPYAFTVTGVAFGLALFRHRMLELVPATRQLGRRAAVRDLDEGVVVLDEERRIVYCNPAAGDTLDVDPETALGEPIDGLLPRTDLDFDAPDALATVERDGRIYEVRASPVTDQHERVIGHTLVVREVTEQVEREADLRRQRDELERLDRINRVVRTVNRALVGADSAEAVLEAVPRGLTETGLYPAAAVRDPATGATSVLAGDVDWAGADGDGTGGAGDDRSDDHPTDARSLDDLLPPPALPDDVTSGPVADGGVEVVTGVDEPVGPWAAVPLVHGRTVYGTLTLVGDRPDAFGPRERTVLAELGETIGYAVNAAEKTRLLTSDAVVEVTLSTTDDRAVLATLAGQLDATLRLDGIVPAGGGGGGDGGAAGVDPEAEGDVECGEDGVGEEDAEDADGTNADAGASDGEDGAPDVDRRGAGVGGLLVYLDVDGATVEEVLAAAADRPAVTAARAVGERRVEIGLSGGSTLFGLVECGANVRSLRASGGESTVVAEVAPGADTRTVLRRVREDVDVDLRSKRELGRPVDRVDGLAGSTLEDLTDRQSEALEAAFRAGYFDWPRESTAEDVADSMGVSSPTLHGHLRKAERKVFSSVFDEDGEDRTD